MTILWPPPCSPRQLHRKVQSNSSSHPSLAWPSHCPLTLWFVIIMCVGILSSLFSLSLSLPHSFPALLWRSRGHSPVCQDNIIYNKFMALFVERSVCVFCWWGERKMRNGIVTAEQIFRDFLYDNSGTHCTNYEWNESTSAQFSWPVVFMLVELVLIPCLDH